MLFIGPLGTGKTHLAQAIAREDIVVGKSLDARRFANGKIADGSIGLAKHVFASGHSVVSRLEGLGWLVQRTSRVSRIAAGSGLVVMIGPARRGVWCGQATQRVANGAPTGRGEEQFARAEGFDLSLELPGRHRWTTAEPVVGPIVARDKLSPHQFVLRMGGRGKRPTDVGRHGKLGIGQLEADELHLIGESTAQQAADILKNEGARLEFTHGADGLGKHVSVVLMPSRLAPHRKRLARRTTGDEVNRIELGKIHVPHVALDDLPLGPILAERRAGVGIPLEPRHGPKSRLLQPRGQATGAGEEFDGLHGRFFRPSFQGAGAVKARGGRAGSRDGPLGLAASP